MLLDVVVVQPPRHADHAAACPSNGGAGAELLLITTMLPSGVCLVRSRPCDHIQLAYHLISRTFVAVLLQFVPGGMVVQKMVVLGDSVWRRTVEACCGPH